MEHKVVIANLVCGIFYISQKSIWPLGQNQKHVFAGFFISTQ